MTREQDHPAPEGDRQEPEPGQSLGQYKRLFVQRTDCYGRQRERSRLYYRVASPLTDAVLQRHLRGDVTVGLYSLDRAGTTRWTVLDSDQGLEPILAAKDALAKRDIPSFIESSRAGGHLWVFWDRPVQATVARRIVEPSGQGLEVFPAGDIPDEDGLGLLLRAPLGVHRYSGQRYPFVHPDGTPVSPGVVRGQIEWLARTVRRVDPTPFAERLSNLSSPRESLVYERGKTERSPIRQWVAEHPIREVVERYVRLNKAGVGHCPWPEHHKDKDRHCSFQVFEKTNRFWCYSSRTGGDAASFIMRYENIDAQTFYRRMKNGGY